MLTSLSPITSRFGRGGTFIRSRDGLGLSDEQILAAAPSVYAAEKHASRSDKYQFISTFDTLAAFRKEGFEVVEVRQGGSKDETKRGFTKHCIKFRKPGQQMKAVGDCLPELSLLNGHDGTSRWILAQAWFRLVCLNGMTVQDDKHPATNVAIAHRGRNVLGDVVDAAYRVIGGFDHSAGQIERFQTIQLTQDEQGVYSQAAANLRWNVEAPIDHQRLLFARREADQGNDLWRVFNRTQENLTKGGQTYTTVNNQLRETHRHTRPVNSVEGDNALNRALWVLTTKMAELKA